MVAKRANKPLRYCCSTNSRLYRIKTQRDQRINGERTFKIVQTADIPPNTRIFKSRFLDEIKNPITDRAFEKSRLVVQAYNDEGKDMVLTQSPTIQRSSQRIILALTAILQGSNTGLYLRDISQAYVQSTTYLNRVFFVRPPPEVKMSPGTIWQVLKPLYGIPEAGNHWFNTYHRHHVEKLSMSPSTYDPCLLSTSGDCLGVVGLQTDDTLFLADKEFAAREQKELENANFLAKKREKLTAKTPLKFNGGIVTIVEDAVILQQAQQSKNLHLVGSYKTDISGTRGKIRKGVTPKDQYIAQRARGAYIASICQPEASFDLSFAAQVVNPKEDDAKTLNQRLKWQIDNSERGIKFVKLDVNTLRIIVFTDASFANNDDMTSQIGFVIVLADEKNNSNLIHWTSVRCKRVTRSVLASEPYGKASKSLFDYLVKLGTTQEKRLMIDIMSLRQSYERREIAEIKWIDGNTNPADAMTKSKPCSALKELIDTNKVNLRVAGWVDRSVDQTKIKDN